MRAGEKECVCTSARGDTNPKIQVCLDRTRARRKRSPTTRPHRRSGDSFMANEATQMHTLALSVSETDTDTDADTGREML